MNGSSDQSWLKIQRMRSVVSASSRRWRAARWLRARATAFSIRFARTVYWLVPVSVWR